MSLFWFFLGRASGVGAELRLEAEEGDTSGDVDPDALSEAMAVIFLDEVQGATAANVNPIIGNGVAAKRVLRRLCNEPQKPRERHGGEARRGSRGRWRRSCCCFAGGRDAAGSVGGKEERGLLHSISPPSQAAMVDPLTSSQNPWHDVRWGRDPGEAARAREVAAIRREHREEEREAGHPHTNLLNPPQHCRRPAELSPLCCSC